MSLKQQIFVDLPFDKSNDYLLIAVNEIVYSGSNLDHNF